MRNSRCTDRGGPRVPGAPGHPSAEAPVDTPTAPRQAAAAVAGAFPGCRPVRIPRDEIAGYDGRLEYWDADTETAWVVRSPTSPWHELPGQRLARLTERIAATRGAPVETLGGADLLLRNQAGERRRILQADQIVYLRPHAVRRLGDAVEVGEDELPDVVLEVDLTTDVRRGKLALYESWGFPEVWVDVPDHRAPSSPVSRAPGLTIHLLGPDGYGAAATSRAFAGWSAAEIHRALNEDALSGETVFVLRRVGRALGDQAGTGPDDDLFLRAERRDGRIAGRREGVRQAVVEILDLRGVRRSRGFAARFDAFAALPAADLTRAAFECRDEEHFLQRLDLQRLDTLARR